MSKTFDASNVSRRKFLAVASTVAAASSLAVGKDSQSAQASAATVLPVHYLVTIDVTTGSVSYSALNKDTQQDVPMPNNSLTVNAGDEVKWQANTTGPKPRHRAGIRFTTTTPFAVKEFKWSENKSDGGNTQNAGTHPYCVGVFDKVKQEVYFDDPKIIVGGGVTVKAEIVEAKSELNEVKEKIESIEMLLSKAIEQL
jgi:hypothetical protein